MEWYKHVNEHPTVIMSWMSEKEKESYWKEYNKMSNRIMSIILIISVLMLAFYFL